MTRRLDVCYPQEGSPIPRLKPLQTSPIRPGFSSTPGRASRAGISSTLERIKGIPATATLQAESVLDSTDVTNTLKSTLRDSKSNWPVCRRPPSGPDRSDSELSTVDTGVVRIPEVSTFGTSTPTSKSQVAVGSRSGSAVPGTLPAGKHVRINPRSRASRPCASLRS